MGAFFTSVEAHGVAQRVVEPGPHALILPMGEIVPDQFPWRQIVRQHPPRAATADQVEDRIGDRALRVFLRTTGFSCFWNRGIEERPLLIPKVTGIRFRATGIYHPQFRSQTDPAHDPKLHRGFLDALLAVLGGEGSDNAAKASRNATSKDLASLTSMKVITTPLIRLAS